MRFTWLQSGCPRRVPGQGGTCNPSCLGRVVRLQLWLSRRMCDGHDLVRFMRCILRAWRPERGLRKRHSVRVPQEVVNRVSDGIKPSG